MPIVSRTPLNAQRPALASEAPTSPTSATSTTSRNDARAVASATTPGNVEVDRFEAGRSTSSAADPRSQRPRAVSAALAGLTALTDGASAVARRLGKGAIAALLGASLLGGAFAGLSSSNAPASPPMSMTQVRVLQQAKVPALHLERVTQAVGLSEAELLNAVTRASASTTLQQDIHIPIEGGQLTLPMGTTFSVDISDNGLSLHASPAVELSLDWKPDAELKRFAFNFADGQFHVDAAGLGPDAIYSKIATDRVNAMLLPILPAELKTPGFDPHTRGHVELLMGTIAGILGGASAAPSSATHASALQTLPLDAVDLTVDLTVPRALHHDLGGGIALALAEQAHLQVSARATIADGGQLASATVRSFSSEGVRIERNGDELQSLTLNTLTATANAPGSAEAFTVRADYDLAVEQGLRGLIALVGAVVGAGHGVSPEVGAAVAVERAGEVHINPVRRMIDDAIQKLSTPLAHAVGSLQPATPGIAPLVPRS